MLVPLLVAACAPGGAGGVAAGPRPPADPAPAAEPAQPGADPISFLAWAFTPIFQAMFIVLAAFYDCSSTSASQPRSGGPSSC